jgi:hypothetical protein
MNTPKELLTSDQRKNIIVDDCWFEWQLADGTRIDNPYNVEKQDVFAMVLHSKGIIYREHRMYCHIDDAWKILQGGRFGKWKTADLLVTLRQALRERYAQGMALDIPKPGISQRALKEWLVIARHYDAIHHGNATF